MVGEIWTYKATKPSDDLEKIRPVLIIGNDSSNIIQFIDIHYVIISSSAECGLYDVELSLCEAQKVGLDRKSVIKTTKIYTGPKSKLGKKIGVLPEDILVEFKKKYQSYQYELINKMNIYEYE